MVPPPCLRAHEENECRRRLLEEPAWNFLERMFTGKHSFAVRQRARSRIGRPRQAGIQPSFQVGPGGQIEPDDLAPGENARDVEIGNGEGVSREMAAAGECPVQYSERLL